LSSLGERPPQLASVKVNKKVNESKGIPFMRLSLESGRYLASPSPRIKCRMKRRR